MRIESKKILDSIKYVCFRLHYNDITSFVNIWKYGTLSIHRMKLEKKVREKLEKLSHDNALLYWVGNLVLIQWKYRNYRKLSRYGALHLLTLSKLSFHLCLYSSRFAWDGEIWNSFKWTWKWWFGMFEKVPWQSQCVR